MALDHYIHQPDVDWNSGHLHHLQQQIVDRARPVKQICAVPRPAGVEDLVAHYAAISN
jgi:hypothetical protein